MKTENDSPKEYPWCMEVIESFNLQDDLAKHTDLFDLSKMPEGQMNVFGKLARQIMPALATSPEQEITPYVTGLFVGQQHANMCALDEHLENLPKGPEADEAARKKMKELHANRNKPGVESSMKILGDEQPLMAWFKASKGKLIEIVQKALKVAAQQPHEEALAFAKGYAKGLASRGIDGAKVVKWTTATPLFLKIYFHWKEIEALQSVREMKEFLLRNGIAESELRNERRLQQICTRMKLLGQKEQ
jgi:hypothetical protein